MNLEQLLSLGAAISRELQAGAAAPATVAPAAPAAAPMRRPADRDGAEPWTFAGFSGDARVMTSFGELPIKALRLRDPLRTPDGSYVTVQWIDRLNLDEGFLHGRPDAHPVCIAAGALGQERPKNELVVSPHQVVATNDLQFRQEFRSARDLTGRPGIMRRPGTVVTYYLFHCGKPATVMVEGVWVRVEP
ncbi:MAG: Hint domain-containing protein [Rhodobacteraceae bacterium]|nr:Hint domain-containing protein [Paracoccaceae bacterium]